MNIPMVTGAGGSRSGGGLGIAARILFCLGVLSAACQSRRTTARRIADALDGRSRATHRDWVRAVLTDVSAALRRMDAGQYGCCHLCDRPIPLACLRILPHARYCGPCHQLKEAIS